MAVITISRELGSLGSYIARDTAHRLQIPLLDKSVIERLLLVARRIQLAQGNKQFKEYKIRWDVVDSDMIYLYDRVIQSASLWGNCVMLGRGTFAALQHKSDVLNVRIQAPYPLRVQRVMEKEHLTLQEDVEILIKESDRVRSLFIRDWYGRDWDAAASFHLVVDTSVIAPELAVDWIVEWYQDHQTSQANLKPANDQMEADLNLRTGVFAELDRLERHPTPVLED
jgi:cytidylate kinase